MPSPVEMRQVSSLLLCMLFTLLQYSADAWKHVTETVTNLLIECPHMPC